jgi:(1->4)-alpha-D-glucan 1-alpha-D-glucosylmutase
MKPDIVPRATYRIQFTKEFGFSNAAAIAPYLAKLGVSHVYASPYLRARSGSTHGYDIVSHIELNPELGDERDFHNMVTAFTDNGLGQIIDFVPNHMGVGGADNPWWLDVLEWGPQSEFAGWFDIDWRTDHSYLRNKLLVPFLGEQYGRALETGVLKLKFDPSEGTFAVWAYDLHKLPIRPADYGVVLGNELPELEQLSDCFANLGSHQFSVANRADELKAELGRLARSSSKVTAAIDHRLSQFHGGDAMETWLRLDELIAKQNWRPAHFRVASDDINYRRFFNVSDLAGIRMEIPELFDHAHRLVFRLLEEGIIQGIRLDHIDGLLDPKAYCLRLKEKAPSDFHLLVEKILAPHEKLREEWSVDGTTGYEVANLLTGLLIDPAGEKQLTDFYHEFTGSKAEFEELTRLSKLEIIDDEMASEMNVLAREAGRLARSNPRTADFTDGVLRRALRQMVACFPVYRTYIDSTSTTDEDRRDVAWAFSRARRCEPGLDATVFDFLHGVLTADIVSRPQSGFSRVGVLKIVMRMQQYTGPVMAKGLEDTAFYRYNRLLALNEVGGQPEKFGRSVAAFHQANIERLKNYPHSLITTSTHDTKRGEDARARLTVLSELPEAWESHVRLWSRALREAGGNDSRSIDPNDEYAFFQTLVGSWPEQLADRANLSASDLGTLQERVAKTMLKIIREAKTHTRWSNPDVEYEEVVARFVARALDATRRNVFLDSFITWMKDVAGFGRTNSLIQLVLKMTIPGIPDIYQGAEGWDFSMVDPDNRRAVDYRLMQTEVAAKAQEGTSNPKWILTNQLLKLRKDQSSLFRGGRYVPIVPSSRAEKICAFMREKDGNAVISAVALHQARPGNWDGIQLTGHPEGTWRSVFTGRRITGALLAAEVFRDVPFEVLLKE